MATVNLGQIKPVFKGAYNNSTAYVLDNIVTSSGSSYICILASTGNAVSNATYWSSLATGASVSASDLTAGTLPDGRFPATLPAASAANLTAVPAANITGTLPAISGANLTGISTGITHASSFKLPSSVTITTNNTWTDITAWTDLAGSNHAPDVGAAVTHSSGIFSFPVTGLWMITGSVGQGYGNTKRRMILNCRGTSDNSSYSEMGRSVSSQYDTGGTPNDTNPITLFFNVTNTTNCKVHFRTYNEWVTGTQNIIMAWDDHAPMIFLRIGDSI